MNAAKTRLLSRTGAAMLVLIGTSLIPNDATAQEDVLRFFGGAAIALGMHESGHLVLDAAFDASPGIRKETFGPFPFFAITHDPLTPRKEFAVSSAGFWVQHLSDEIILTRMPDLRARHSPLIKGMVAFNVLTSVGYAAAAFARSGPEERDTRGMAASADVPEPVIGLLLLAPATLDAASYFEPDHPWLTWTSRAAKVASVVLIAKTR